MNILHFDTEESWLAGTITYWRDRLRVKPSLKHCLASGNTPIPIYRAMARACQEKQVSFAAASVFALDEFGGLASDDAGRCSNMLRRDLVNHVDLKPANFHVFNPEAADLQVECAAFDRAVGDGFNLVILGIGMNGHLGMNEPGSAADSPTRKTDLHESTISSSAKYLTHDRLPRWGLTVGMRQFFAADEVWLVATGEAKAEIIRQVVRGESTEAVPASLMRRHPNCSLFIDDRAASRL